MGSVCSFFGGEFYVGEAEEGAGGLVGKIFNSPAVGQHDLLNDGESKAGAFLVRGEIGLEDFSAVFGGDAGTVVGNFNDRPGAVGTGGADADFAMLLNRLGGVEDEI